MAEEKEDDKLDSNRYYYRPGTTEPELRPEFVVPESVETPEPPKAATKKAPAKKK